MNNSGRSKILSSINWNFINTIIQTVLNFGVGVVLARILDPVDFGIFGLTVILFGILNLLFTGSISRYIIQKKELDESDIHTSFGISIVLSFISYVIIWFISPLVSSFFNEEILTGLIRIFTIAIFFFSISSILRGILIKNLNFRLIFYSDTLSMVFGYAIVGIVLAINNFGVISLVYASLAKEIISLFSLFIFTKVRISFKINPQRVKKIFYYSGGIGLSNIFGYTSNNADYVIIGKFLDSNALGLYQRAFTIMTLPLSKISMTIFDVIFSVFSGVQNDLEEIKRIYLKTIKIIALISFPVLATIIAGAELIVIGIYGEKWSGAVAVLQILCFSGFFRVTTNSAGAVAKATGKVYSEAWRQMVFAALLITGCLIGIKYGIEGVGAAVVISTVWLYISLGNLAIKIAGIKWSEFIKAHLPGLLLLFLITVVNIITIKVLEYLIMPGEHIWRLLILTTVSFLVSLLLIKTLPVKILGEEGKYLVSFYLSKLKPVTKNIK